VTTAARRLRPYLIKTAVVLVGIALAVFLGWLFESERAARATCAADGGTWRVVELRAVMPKICEGSP